MTAGGASVPAIKDEIIHKIGHIIGACPLMCPFYESAFRCVLHFSIDFKVDLLYNKKECTAAVRQRIFGNKEDLGNEKF